MQNKSKVNKKHATTEDTEKISENTVKKQRKIVVARKASSKAKKAGGLPPRAQRSLMIDVYNTKGKVVEKIALPKELFGQKVNTTLMAQAVRVYLANQRKGTVSTKTRGEVNKTTAKWYKQKGTGRARHGAKSAPIFVGGGVVFGPKPRDYSLQLPKKMKRKALFSALSTKLKDNEIKIVSGLEKLDGKTKAMAGVIESLGLSGKKILLVLSDAPKRSNGVYRAARNIEGVNVISPNGLNTYEVLNSKEVFFMKQAIDAVSKAYLKSNN